MHTTVRVRIAANFQLLTATPKGAMTRLPVAEPAAQSSCSQVPAAIIKPYLGSYPCAVILIILTQTFSRATPVLTPPTLVDAPPPPQPPSRPPTHPPLVELGGQSSC